MHCFRSDIYRDAVIFCVCYVNESPLFREGTRLQRTRKMKMKTYAKQPDIDISRD